MSKRPFKPSLMFLRRVQNGQVYSYVSWTRRGCAHGFRGGEKTARAHAAAGYIKGPCLADPGRRSYAELTDAGRRALHEAGHGE